MQNVSEKKLHDYCLNILDALQQEIEKSDILRAWREVRILTIECFKTNNNDERELTCDVAISSVDYKQSGIFLWKGKGTRNFSNVPRPYIGREQGQPFSELNEYLSGLKDIIIKDFLKENSEVKEKFLDKLIEDQENIKNGKKIIQEMYNEL